MTEITTYETLQAALNALAPELADRAAEMDDARRLPADLAGKMAAAGALTGVMRARMALAPTISACGLSPKAVNANRNPPTSTGSA